MSATESVSRLHSHYFSSTKPLTKADGIEILGAVFAYLRDKYLVLSLSDIHANQSAQDTVETLRKQLWRETYGRRE